MIGIGSLVNGKYQILRLLGDGGMGSVYEGKHTVLGSRVAIKVLHPELGRRTGLVERFLQEARVAAQIRSPHVVQVTDVDRTSDGDAYIVMELLEGEPLSAVMERQRRIPVATACDYTLQILEALEAAHALGVIHRDLKPENVFVTFSGGKPLLKLIDFGIAKARRTDPQEKKLTVAGVVMGTAEYMAPEQARSADKVDARADIYAVGVMLYEMIAGSRPINGEDARIIALKVERGEIIPLVQAAPDAPRELAGLVHRAMAARQELRFASATEMRLALEKAAATISKRLTGAGAGTTGPLPTSAAAPAPPVSAPEMTATGTVKNLSAQHVAAGVEAGRGGTARLPAQVPASPSASGHEPSPNTERAPPLATAMTGPLAAVAPATPVYAGVAMSPPQNAAGRSRGGGAGRLAALIALPILLGVGVVLVLVATGTWSPSSGSDPPPPPPTHTAQPEAAAPTSSGPPTIETASPTGAPVPTLAPSRPGPGPGPGPGPRPGPSSRPPHGVPDAGSGEPPPFILPSTLPTALPSGLGLPPGFPTAFPAWPPPPPPPAGSSGSI
ncbi:MAG: serine/threonine-protein kinase [Polyangiaceae bacterium]